MNKLQRKALKAQRLLKQKRYIQMGECNFCGDCCDLEDCEYFKQINPDFGICTVFGKPERFARCPLFPEGPRHPFKRCGYFFQDRHDNGKLIYPEEWPGPQGNIIDDSNSSTP